jgi:hypothetical protein
VYCNINESMVYHTHASNQPHAGGDSYEGEWENGKWHGSGKAVWVAGQQYEGAWREGLPHGGGVCRCEKSGLVFDGVWKEGAPAVKPDRFHGVWRVVDCRVGLYVCSDERPCYDQCPRPCQQTNHSH